MATMSFVIDPELKEELAEIAKFERRSIGFLLNEASREFVKKKKEEIMEDLELYYMSVEVENSPEISEDDADAYFLSRKNEKRN